jgi:F-type H+-transporting ATPase subunit b
VILRVVFALSLLFAAPTAVFAAGDDHHGPELSFKRILFADVGENASEEEIAEAKHHTLEFWGAVVNFGLLLLVLRRLGGKPLASFLKERRREIEVGMSEAAEAKAKAEAVFGEYNERMKTLDQELAKLREDMAKAAADEKARIVADAENDAKRTRAETEALIARQAEQLEAQIRREVVEAAVAAAERAVRETANADDQKRMADAFAKELSRVATEKRA